MRKKVYIDKPVNILEFLIDFLSQICLRGRLFYD